jgi:hypothetical protein
MRCASNSTRSYLHRSLSSQSEVPMKPLQLRGRRTAQTDLFDSAGPLPTLTSLQLHHDELVDLLSQLLWQVVRDAEATLHLEDGNEQDQS